MNDPAAGAVHFFTTDHRDCDALWARLESTGEDGGPAAVELWERYDAAMRRHFAMEEEVLFPTFEQTTGMTGGPTMVMRAEHEQMRGLLDRMTELAAAGDFEALLDEGDTLHLLVQQHNAKEEGILYPMAGQVLAAAWSGVAERLRGY